MGMALKIKIILLERNMTIKELAEKLGTSGKQFKQQTQKRQFQGKRAAANCAGVELRL